MKNNYTPSSVKKDWIQTSALALLLGLSSLANAQQGSWGNTTVGGGGQATLFGAHTFVPGGAGTQPGIVRTIRTAPVGIVNFGPAATHSGANDAGHVDGYVGKYGTTAFTFPIGNGTKMRTAGISAPTSGVFQAAYWFANPSNATLPAGNMPTTNLGTNVLAVSNVEYWDVNGPSAINLTLTWDAASNLGLLPAATISNVVVVGYNTTTSKWENLGRAGGVTGTLATTGSVTANGVTPDNYAAFTFGLALIGTPDLTVIIDNSVNILPVNTTGVADVYIENITGFETNGPVVVTIARPTSNSGLNLVIDPSPDWVVTAPNAFSYTLTLVGSVPAGSSKVFTARVNRTGGSVGNYNFLPIIANNAGGETNNANNRAAVVFIKN
jgi:hypothetical protein